MFILLSVGGWLLLVFAYRIAPPPLTPLMLIRWVESFWGNSDGSRAWRWLPMNSIPTHVAQAVVTAEDSRFMRHWGIDISAVSEALSGSNGRRQLRGASTITMQTVKNLFLWPGRSYIRKGFEWLMAPVAGAVWGKRRTLELYLNVIEWGDGIYGIEAAARYYFHKPASRLTVTEAAALASILPNPRKLSPLRMSHTAQKRYARIVKELAATEIPGWRS